MRVRLIHMNYSSSPSRIHFVVEMMKLGVIANETFWTSQVSLLPISEVD